MKLFTAILCFTLVYIPAAEGTTSCRSPPSIANGDYLIMTPSYDCSFTYGFDISCTVRVICDDGYHRNGTSFVYCENTKDGYQWAQIPTCEAKALCADGKKPGRLRNGNVVVSGGTLAPNKRYTVGTTLEYTCKSGHRQSGKSVRSCLHTGWTAGKPRCTPVLCAPLQNVSITNGWSDAQNRTYYRSDTINFYCNPGYRPTSKSWRVCYEDSKGETKWTDETPTCEVIRCPRIRRLENGDAFTSNTETLTVGTFVDFECHRGYVLIGPAHVVCESNGRWSGTSVCDSGATDCVNPGTPLNGRKTGVRYDANEMVIFECNPGYTLIGSSERVCLCNGNTCTWSGEQPTCRGAHEFDDIDDVIKRFVDKTSSIANDTDGGLIMGPVARTIDINYDGGWNIYFVFDASNSVGEANFKKAITFAKALVSKVGVGKARYGAVVFASQTIPTFYPVDPYYTVPAVHVALQEAERISETKRDELGGGTDTNSALFKVKHELIPNTDYREGAKNAIFLITDGLANEGGNPEQIAKELKRDDNVAFHCIGVGDSIDKDQLTRLASQPHTEHLFMMETYDNIESLAYAVTRQEEVFTQCGIGLGPTGENNILAMARIIGGNNAPEGAWPWMAGIYKQTNIEIPEHFCGGTLISPDWILTAAHCCFEPDINPDDPKIPLKPQHMKVSLGTVNKYTSEEDLAENQIVVNIVEIIKHELYNETVHPTRDYDIALLRVDPLQRVELSRRVRTICLPNLDEDNSDLKKLGEGQRGHPFPYVTGWGSTQFPNVVPATHLLQLAIPLKGTRTCVQSIEDLIQNAEANEEPILWDVNDFSERMRCAGYRIGEETESGEEFKITDRRDACGGDSGGPLVRKRVADDGRESWYQIGIVSWGYGCAHPGLYGYYTDVLKFTDWIGEKMGQ